MIQVALSAQERAFLVELLHRLQFTVDTLDEGQMAVNVLRKLEGADLAPAPSTGPGEGA